MANARVMSLADTESCSCSRLVLGWRWWLAVNSCLEVDKAVVVGASWSL